MSDRRRKRTPKPGRAAGRAPCLRWGAAISLALLSLACASPAPPRGDDAPTRRALEASLEALPGMPAGSAHELAVAALDTSAELHAAYRPTRSPKLGNLAFHVGLRDRALCCHWTRDLLHTLSALDLKGVELHWGVAHHGEVLREHSAVIVVPEGARFEQGLVLDAWRNAGHLYFTPVAGDRYPWKPHPSDPKRLRIGCRSGS